MTVPELRHAHVPINDGGLTHGAWVTEVGGMVQAHGRTDCGRPVLGVAVSWSELLDCMVCRRAGPKMPPRGVLRIARQAEGGGK